MSRSLIERRWPLSAALVLCAAVLSGCVVFETIADPEIADSGFAAEDSSIDSGPPPDGGDTALDSTTFDSMDDVGIDVQTDGDANTDGDVGDTAPSADSAETAPDADADAVPPCVTTASPHDDACVITNELGVFVSSSGGNDTAAGTQLAPLKTVAAGLAKAKMLGRRVYLCGELFAENVSLVNGVSLYGGLDCAAGWKPDLTKPTIISPTVSPAINALDITTEVRVEGVTLRSPDAAAPSGSSLVAIARNSRLVFDRTSLIAGSGGAGTPGAAGMAGRPVDVFANGGTPNVNVCIDGVGGEGGGVGAQKGGKGGDGGCDASTLAGKNAAVASSTCGKGGVGASSAGAGCSAGQLGCAGSAGPNGAAGTSLGSLSPTSYSATNAGGAGVAGSDGGGGGGGGAGWFNEPTGEDAASGGGGGGGGFAGMGGGGGAGGGASIVMIATDSNIRFERSTLKSGSAGAGGRGGDGGNGGAGGDAGNGGGGASTPTWRKGCPGGAGGAGGAGGHGGGGGGGPSVAIVWRGIKPVISATSTATVGTPGAAGPSKGNPGAPGLAASFHEF